MHNKNYTPRKTKMTIYDGRSICFFFSLITEIGAKGGTSKKGFKSD